MIFSEVAIEAADEITKRFRKPDSSQVGGDLIGRAADNGPSLPWLACMAAQCGDGNHVDIGTLFGASALTVALTKKRLGHSGTVYCIDPYLPRTVSYSSTLAEEDREGTPEKLMENAKRVGVELTLIQKRSWPWPEELNGVNFSTAYIDGDHWGEAPYRDFRSLTWRTEKCIALDNYEPAFPDVESAVLRALATRHWDVFFKNAGFIALRRHFMDRERKTNPVLT